MLRACSANLHPQNCTCMTESPRTANPLPPANFSPRESIDRRAGAANTPQRIDRTFPGRELLSAGIGQQTRRRSQNSTTSRPGVPRTRTPLRGESVNRRAGAAKTPHRADQAFPGFSRTPNQRTFSTGESINTPVGSKLLSPNKLPGDPNRHTGFRRQASELFKYYDL